MFTWVNAPDIRYKKMPDIAHQLKAECTVQCGRHTGGSPDKAVVNFNCRVTTAEVYQAVRQLLVTTSKKDLLASNKQNGNVLLTNKLKIEFNQKFMQIY